MGNSCSSQSYDEKQKPYISKNDNDKPQKKPQENPQEYPNKNKNSISDEEKKNQEQLADLFRQANENYEDLFKEMNTLDKQLADLCQDLKEQVKENEII